MLRYAAVAILAVLGLVLIVPLIVVVAFPWTAFALIERAVLQSTGFELSVRDVDVSLAPVTLSVAGLQVAHPRFETPLLAIDEATATVGLRDLISGGSTWWHGSVADLDLRLEGDEEGSNWQRPVPPRKPIDLSRLLDFSRIELQDVEVVRAGEEEDRVHAQRVLLERQPGQHFFVDAAGEFRDEPLEVSGTVVWPDATRAGEVDLEFRSFSGTVAMTGTLGHSGGSSGSATFRADLESTGVLDVLLDQTLHGLAPVRLEGNLRAPDPGEWRLEVEGELAGRPLALDAHLSAGEGRYRLHELELAFASSSARLSGLLDADARRLSGRIEADDIVLDELPRWGTTPAPGGGTPWLQKRPRLPRPLQTWRYELDVAAATIAAGASRLAGLRVVASNETGALTFDGSLQAADLPLADGSRLQLAAPFDLEARAELSTEWNPGLEAVVATLATRDLRGRVRITLPQTRERPLALDVQAQLASLDAFGGAPGGGLVPAWALPLRLDLEAQERDSTWTIGLREAAFADAVFDGRVTVDTAALPVSVGGELHASEIDLDRIGAVGGADSGGASTGDGAPDRLISDAALDWGWLAAASLDLDLRADRLRYAGASWHKARARLRLQDQRLDIEPLSVELGGGTINGHLRLAAREEGVGAAAHLVGDRIFPAELGPAYGDVIEGGAIDLLVDLEAVGRSPRDLAASLNGEIALDMKAAKVSTQVLDELGSPVAETLMRHLNPLLKRDGTSQLECLAAHIVLEDGRLISRESVVLEMDDITVRAGGVVDLRDETLMIDFRPLLRRKLLRLRIGSIAELVRVDGTLVDPKVRPDPAGVLAHGAKVGAAVATGGISWLAQGMMWGAGKPGTVCSTVLREGLAETGEER